MLKNAAPSPPAQAAKTSWMSFLFSVALILPSFLFFLSVFSLYKLLIYLRPAVGKQVPLVLEGDDFIQIDGGGHQIIALSLRLRQHFAGRGDNLTAADILGPVLYACFTHGNDEKLVFDSRGAQQDFRGFLSGFAGLTEGRGIVRYADEFRTTQGQGAVAFGETTVIADECSQPSLGEGDDWEAEIAEREIALLQNV